MILRPLPSLTLARNCVPPMSNGNGALVYLDASGAAAISIVRSETGCSFRTGLTGHNVGDYPVSGHAGTCQNRRECRVGPGNFTPSLSQIRTLYSRIIRLVTSHECCRLP